MLEEVKKRIMKYNGNINFNNNIVEIYGKIKKNKKPDNLLGYTFDDKFNIKKEGDFIKWSGKIKKDDLIDRENKLKYSKNTEGDKRKKFKVKKRKKKERRIQMELNEFRKGYNN